MPMEPITQEHHVNINNKPIEKLLSLTAQQFSCVGLCAIYLLRTFFCFISFAWAFLWFSKYNPMIVFIVTAQNSFSFEFFWLLSDCSSLLSTTCTKHCALDAFIHKLLFATLSRKCFFHMSSFHLMSSILFQSNSPALYRVDVVNFCAFPV